MNKGMWSVWVGVLVVGVGVSPALTAEDAVVVPDPLYLAEIPDGLRCVTRIGYPSLDKAREEGRSLQIAAYPVTREIAVLAGRETRVVTDSNGREEQFFLRGGLIVRDDSEAGVSFEAATTENTVGLASHFPELQWVDKAAFAGELVVDGEDYFVYEQEGGLPDSGRRLLVSAVTRLPVTFQDGRAISYDYAYERVAAEDLDVPAKIERVFREIQERAGGDR